MNEASSSRFSWSGIDDSDVEDFIFAERRNANLHSLFVEMIPFPGSAKAIAPDDLAPRVALPEVGLMGAMLAPLILRASVIFASPAEDQISGTAALDRQGLVRWLSLHETWPPEVAALEVDGVLTALARRTEFDLPVRLILEFVAQLPKPK